MSVNLSQSLFELHNRVILITGATGHLGAPIAKAIATAGAITILCGRDEAKLALLSAEIENAGGSCTTSVFDIGNSAACKKAIETVSDKFGTLHGLINCAYGGRPATIEASTGEDFELAFNQNLTGPFSLIQASLPLLTKGATEYLGGSSVVNIASMYGMVSPDPRIYGDSGKNNPPYYGAAKAGLIQLTKYLAAHLGAQNIRVNSISPGPFPPTSILDTQPDFHRSLCAKTPLGRIGLSNELIGPTLFLLSDASSYVTGVNMPVDGGWTAW